MAKNKNSNYDSGKDPFVMGFIYLLGFVILGFFYWNSRDVLHPIYYSIKKYQLYPFYFFMPELKDYITGDIQNSGEYTFKEMIEGTAYYGKYAFWTVLPIVIYLLLKVKNKYIFKNKKLQDGKNGSEELLRLNARVHAVVRPVSHRNIREMPSNIGPWRFSETPLIFAVKNNLLYDWKGNPFQFSELYNNVPNDMNSPKFAFAPLVDPRIDCIYIGQKNFFDFDKAYNIFVNQLGTKILFNDIFKSFKNDANKNNQAQWKLLLAGIYYRFGSSKKEKTEYAYVWMDKMATLCGGSDELTVKKFNSITPKDVQEIWKGWQDNEKFINFISNGISFERPFFMHMVTWAKTGGKITPSEFIWLRAIERTLYYSINQIGGRTAYSESLGPWVHYAAERFVGEALHFPYVMTAGQSMYMSLYREGYLPYREFEEENQQLAPEIVRVIEKINLTHGQAFSGGIVTKDVVKTALYQPEKIKKEPEMNTEKPAIKPVSISEKINELKKKLTINEDVFSCFQSPPSFIIGYMIKQKLEEGKWENREAALKKYQNYNNLNISACEWCSKPIQNESTTNENKIYVVPIWSIDDEKGTFELKSLNFLCLHCWVRQYYLYQEILSKKTGKEEDLKQPYAIIITGMENIFKLTVEEFEKNLIVMRQIRDLREKRTWKLEGNLDEMILKQPEKIVVDGVVQKIF